MKKNPFIASHLQVAGRLHFLLLSEQGMYIHDSAERGHCPLRDASSLLTECTIKQSSYQYACHLTRLTQRDVTYCRYRTIKLNKTNQNF